MRQLLALLDPRAPSQPGAAAGPTQAAAASEPCVSRPHQAAHHAVQARPVGMVPLSAGTGQARRGSGGGGAWPQQPPPQYGAWPVIAGAAGAAPGWPAALQSAQAVRPVQPLQAFAHNQALPARPKHLC